MSWANPNAPNLPDFILFAQNAMQISPLNLPTNSPFFGYAFNRALNLVINIPCAVSGNDYTLAVYNCAGHCLIATAPDQQGRTFFENLRTTFGLNKPSAGVVQSTSDQGTSVNLAVSDATKNMTLGDLMFFNTPWGRYYLAYQQDFGEVWGLS